jgi:hypothetical protein
MANADLMSINESDSKPNSFLILLHSVLTTFSLSAGTKD